MTGRELIIYILENGLEDADIFDKGFSSLFITPEEAAIKWGCGSATVKAMIDMKKVKGVNHLSVYYVLANQPNPFDK